MKAINLEPYRDLPIKRPTTTQRLLQKRIQEMASVSPRFFVYYQRRLARRLTGAVAFGGLLLSGLCLVLGVGLLPILGLSWALISLVLLFSGPLSRRHLAHRLERSLRACDEVTQRPPLPEVLLDELSGRFSEVLLVGFLVLSFLLVTAALPWMAVPVFILSFLVSASFFHLPAAQDNEGSVWPFLRWALLAWVIPAVVISLIVAGALLMSDLVVALGLGLLLGRELSRQTREEASAHHSRTA